MGEKSLCEGCKDGGKGSRSRANSRVRQEMPRTFHLRIVVASLHFVPHLPLLCPYSFDHGRERGYVTER
jgi:hypothetical protein